VHKALIEEMRKRSSKEDLMCALDILEMTLDTMKEENPEFYEHLEMKLYENIYGKTLSKEMAEKIITNMKPYHMKWSLEQTKDVQKQFDMENIRDIDFWVVMNSAYNDYSNIFDDNIEMYAKYTKDFIKDEDAKEGKVFLYFTKIPM
jgi:hypothetical protein